MTLTSFRARRYAPAAGLLLVLAALLAVPHAGPPHYDAEESIVAPSHGTAERVGRTPADERLPEHCAVCHWARAFRLLAQGSAFTTPATPSVTLRTFLVIPPTNAGAAAAPSLRGPPLSPA